MEKFFKDAEQKGCQVRETDARFPFHYSGSHRAFLVTHASRPDNVMYICLREDGAILDSQLEEAA